MKISLPFSEEDYINLLLQRTDFIVKNGLDSALSHWANSGSTEGIKELISNKPFMQEYLEDTLKKCQLEATNIISHVKQTSSHIESFLSIGCGNALVEMFIAQQIRPSIIYLIDIEQTPGKHHHGLAKNGAGYTSLQTAVKFLESNLDYRPVIVAINPLQQNLPSIKVDLIISLFSAGFHYSMNQYREFMTSSTLRGGLLIFDERKRHDIPLGFEFNCNEFANLKCCSAGSGHERKLMIRI